MRSQPAGVLINYRPRCAAGKLPSSRDGPPSSLSSHMRPPPSPSLADCPSLLRLGYWSSVLHLPLHYPLPPCRHMCGSLATSESVFESTSGAPSTSTCASSWRESGLAFPTWSFDSSRAVCPNPSFHIGMALPAPATSTMLPLPSGTLHRTPMHCWFCLRSPIPSNRRWSSEARATDPLELVDVMREDLACGGSKCALSLEELSTLRHPPHSKKIIILKRR